MAGGRVQVNKPHKTRFSSKSSRNVHKTPGGPRDAGKIAKPERNRTARIQRCKMLREQKRAATLKAKRASCGSTSPPRVIVLFALSASVNLDTLAEDLLTSLSTKTAGSVFPTVASSQYNLRATVLKAPHGDLLSCMEMAKVADLIAFVASATSFVEESSCNYIDLFGTECLSVFRSLGMPSTAVLIRDLPTELRKKNELKKMCISSLSPEFPEKCEFYLADSKDELHKFLGILKDQMIKVPLWRTQRPYIMAQKVDIVAQNCNSDKCTLAFTGYLRSRSLSKNQLVHVSGVGDFQLGKIELLKDPFPMSARKGQDIMDSDEADDVEVVKSLTPDMMQEPLVVENATDPLAGEQTWPTEAEMAEADNNQKERRRRKRTLPPGTSDYQAAWISDDVNEDDDDNEDGLETCANENGDGMILDGDNGVRDNSDLDDGASLSLDLRDSDGETETGSIMMEDENLTRQQLEEDIRKLKDAHAEDEEFPDEVDTPLDIPARIRFAKYRGLKSFRTSSWDPKESLPSDYSRIFAFGNFTRTQKQVFAKALEMAQENNNCIPAGSYARIHIVEVPVGVASRLCRSSSIVPLVACGLLQHESKMSVLHFSVRKHDKYTAPIKAKEDLIFHVGFRQMIARPIFSSDNFSSDKHKMERFLHAGRVSVASIYAPISFPPHHLVVIKGANGSSAPAVAALGELKCVDPDRIILKKIILTGYPQRVSKLKAVVRYMFHNPEDVKWFKPLEVWTKFGRRGRIKEPVGTHGAMKCLFNGVLQQRDTVCMSLFKRVYPKWPEHRYPICDA